MADQWKGVIVNVKSALIQRSSDMVTWEDWKTMDLEDNTCEAVDLTTDTPQYFYRAVEAEENTTSTTNTE